METETASSRGIPRNIGYTLLNIWEQQRGHNQRVKSIVEQSSQDWAVTYILGMLSEADELLREMGWKHRRSPFGGGDGEPDLRNVAEELADITKYILSLWQEFGFSAVDMLRYLRLKGEMVAQKLAQEFVEPKPGTPIVLTDLDGTIVDLRFGFIQWLLDHGYLGRAPEPSGTLSMSVEAGIPYPKYAATKQEFIRSGGYYVMPAFIDGVHFLRRAKEGGAYIVVVTARETDEKRVWYDTWSWLSDRDIAPDQLLFCSKERALVMSRYATDHNHPVLVLEDDPRLARQLAQIAPVICRAAPYNEELLECSNITRVDTFDKVDLFKLLPLEIPF